MDEQWIVLRGQLGDGYVIYGPFDDYNQALAFGEYSKCDWQIMELFRPEKD